MYEVAEEPQGAGVEGLLQAFDEKAAEEFCERLDGEKEVRPLGDPARLIGERPCRLARRNARVDDASAFAPTCRTATTPICAPSLRGLAASVVIASADAANRIA